MAIDIKILKSLGMGCIAFPMILILLMPFALHGDLANIFFNMPFPISMARRFEVGSFRTGLVLVIHLLPILCYIFLYLKLKQKSYGIDKGRKFLLITYFPIFLIFTIVGIVENKLIILSVGLFLFTLIVFTFFKSQKTQKNIFINIHSWISVFCLFYLILPFLFITYSN